MTENQFTQNKSGWKRIRRIAVIMLGITAVLLVVLPIITGALPMWVLLHPSCGDRNQALPPDVTYQTLAIPARTGETWRAYLISGTGDRARGLIVAPAAFSGNAAGPYGEVGPLAQAGYTVVLYESVICGGRAVHTLGYQEKEQAREILDYLIPRAAEYGFDPALVAFHGFSSAGATSVFVAAEDPRIQAILIEGNYADINAYLSVSSPRNPLEWALVNGARLTYQVVTGYSPNVLAPVNVIRQIVPRPIFLIFGEYEVRRGNADAFSNAVPEAQLWIVPKSDHGGYIANAGAEYHRRVLAFYDCALLGRC